MAQYLMSVLNESSDLATADEMAAIDVFNEQLQADGQWVFAGGLASPGSATVVDARDGEPVFTDGPYLESKEHIVGFWIIEAPHLDVALRLAAGGSKACNRRIELRPFLANE
ncbi:MAG TPA: YciI family protein [Micromonosporaceae bacterium]|nr:YciI family protein [Micromonosporaceae bacterium]